MNYLKTFTAEDGTKYVDKKRYFWLLSLLLPSITVAGPLLFIVFNNEALLWFCFFFAYVFFPVMDHILGEDTSNPPEAVIPLLEADPFYRHIAILHVPVVILAFIFNAWFVGHYNLSWSGYLVTALLAGNVTGHGLNIGHELGHKKDKLSRRLAKLVLAVAAYGHFFIEHNRGHHKHVATPEDPASSKMGESIYHFALRELPGAIARAHQLEKQRLHKKGKSAWSADNEFLQTVLMSLTVYVCLAVWLGTGIIPYLFISAFWSMWQLTSANYIEHYGLLRKKLPNGRYERPQPHHSWNSNHVFSNWALFHLQRHSDHHAHATRSYQSLRHFSQLPTLPNGYFGMYPIAYIPWLWFKVMDKRIVNVTGGDLQKINILPQKRAQLTAKYQLTINPDRVR